MRVPLVAANWKMYKTVREAMAFVEELKAFLRIPCVSTRAENKADMERAAQWLVSRKCGWMAPTLSEFAFRARAHDSMATAS